jgi:hypothetical protein
LACRKGDEQKKEQGIRLIVVKVDIVEYGDNKIPDLGFFQRWL